MPDPAYAVFIKKSAQKEMRRLERRFFDRVSKKILALETIARPRGVRKLHGGEGYRLRVGDYRLLYTIDDAARQVMVYAVRHRREAYS